MEPESSLTYSERPPPLPIHKPEESSPNHPILLFKIYFNIILSSMPRTSKFFSFPQASLCTHFSSHSYELHA